MPAKSSVQDRALRPSAPSYSLSVHSAFALLVSSSACLALLFFAATAHAAKGDKEAKDLARQAMEEDYLATNMTTAVGKLQNALSICEKKGCSKEILANIHGNLGIVYSAGLAAHEDAVASFKRMLGVDPSATPQSAYTSDDVTKDFQRAKAELGGGAGPPTAAAVAVLKETPWTEQATYRPVPVYVEAPEGVTVARVVVRYKAPGEKDWKELTLGKKPGGFGGYIPCGAVERAGTLVYFVTAFDANLDRVASAGSAADPRKVEIKQAISGRQPSLPKTVPPDECPRPAQGLSCENDNDCPGAKKCLNLQCVDESSLEKPEAPEDKTPRVLNWLSLSFSPDISMVSSSKDACSQTAQKDGKLSCFYSDKTQYDGVPQAGNGNSLHGGAAIGSMRILAGYDRVVVPQLTLGLRLGVAILGTPARNDGKSFIPFHAEVRGAYFFTKDPFAGKGVRPYVFLNGGLGQTSAKLSTQVIDEKFGPEKLDVFRTSGPAFGGGGLGVQYAVSKDAAMVVEVAGRAMFPAFAPVIAPSLGFAYGL
jgi:hypothetical protein